MSIYYITRIIGTGVPHVDPYRPEMNTYTISNSAIIPVYMQVDFDNGTIPAGKKIGDPIFTWCLVVIPTGSNTATIDADIASGATNADRLPITSLDATVGSLTGQQRTTLRNIGQKYGVARIAGLTNANTCREALVMIGQALDPLFDASSFDVI
jgi:hypothetical protein